MATVADAASLVMQIASANRGDTICIAPFVCIASGMKEQCTAGIAPPFDGQADAAGLRIGDSFELELKTQ